MKPGAEAAKVPTAGLCELPAPEVTWVAEHGLQVFYSSGNLFLRVTIRRSGDPSLYDDSPEGTNEYRRCRYTTVYFGP